MKIMKKNYLLTILSLLFCFTIQSVNAQFTLASDNASDAAYSGGLADGNNGGSGFSAWSISIGGSTGTFVSNPSNDGMGTTGIGTTAWGFYANSSNYINANRPISIGMEVGDAFTFYWAMNFDTGVSGGNKGFDFKKSDGTTIFNVNNSDTSTITSSNGTADANYGTTPMLVTLTRTSGTQYSFSMTSRSGGAIYSTTISSSDMIDRLNIYSGNQQNNGERNIYFNELSVQNDGSFNIASGTETYSKNLTGTGNLSKSGAGILALSGTNDYSGTTTVSAGTLQLNSSLSASAVTVENGATLQISENATLSSLTVAAGGIVIVDAGTSLNITNNLVNNGTSFNLNSGASMIVGGTSTGNVTYNRTLTFVSGNTNGWHLVSSPVAGEVFDVDFATGGSNAIASGSGTNLGVASYNTTGNTWTYLQSPSGSISSTSGMGYSMKRASTGTVSFTGGINTGDVNGVSVGTADGGFNLLGNPYTAYMSSETFLNANTNTTGQIWTWTHGGGYTARAAIDNFIIVPGQGFFVSAASGTTVNFAEANQSSGTDNFQKTDKTEITLSIANGKLNRSARLLYFDENVTKGFDWGYEGKTFTAIKSEMEVYTHMLENNIGESYQVQSLPKNEMESMVIPVGVTADAGEITFSAEAMNLPEGLKVFLEDRTTNTFTRLDEANASYKVTLTEKTDAIGRFYLHTKSSALSTNEVTLENISIYPTNKATLRIVGLSQGKSTIKLFNILGKQVVNTSFTSNGVYDVNLPKLATGLYIVQLDNETGTLNKKIILE
tara:strand:- start:323 stop:2659 length:2337 start_codon:yes stop_codon:yes gene_type:complete